ncbi:MAG: hypothetical protein GXP55_19625 [Deltaproteobacteria bacterium]|nr:hypothetical protein [Deltaproteobacteria bacterium]
MSRTRFLPLLLLLLGALGCGGGSGSPDGGMGRDASRVDGGGVALDGGPPGVDWPLPIPGSPGTGPACPEPAQGPIGDDWPEVFVGVAGCDDTGAGTRELPFCTFEKAFEVADTVPYIVTVLEGTYRQRGHRLNREGTADEYFVLRADQGARPVILGSDAIAGGDFESATGELFRVDVSGLEKDPKGLWTAEGRRIIHVMETRDGERSHANTADLVEPGSWTKADDSGVGCGRDNAGCFIYMLPFADMDVSTTAFEASQGNFFYSQGDYQVVDGLTIRFTQSTAIFFEGAKHILIQNSDFAHNANGNDNSYGLRLWGADGALVRRNRVSDSRYWGGAVNSHGITFMVGGNEQDIWVCENEVFDIIGHGVSTKNGSSNVHVVGNYLHDLGNGVHTSDSRCHWRGCDVENFPGGGYTIRENLFENCRAGVAIARTDSRPINVTPSRIFNNVFVDTERGVETLRVSTQPFVRNNIFVGTGNGLYFRAGGMTTWPDYFISEGFDSDFNLFDTASAIYVYADWAGTEQAQDLATYQANYSAETDSLEADPMLDDRFMPRAGSPALGSGDPDVYPGATSVNRGLWPFAAP